MKLLENTINKVSAANDIKNAFLSRLKKGKISKAQDPTSHFCVYFPAYDPRNRVVFIGHHKKSGLWLFNGGHMEKDETPHQALGREIAEEWGTDAQIDESIEPELLTITKVESNPAGRFCKEHYDIWFFIPQDSKTFRPDENLLEKEFHQTGWKTFEEARLLAKDSNTLIGINKIEQITQKQALKIAE